MPKKIMLVGEPMGLFIAAEEGPLDRVNHFTAAVAGAELNVAIGLSRLSHPVGYLSKLGRDPFAGRIVSLLEENHIDPSLIRYDDTRGTGFMLKSKVPCDEAGSALGDPEISYHRRGSAASALCRADIDALNFSEYGYLHVTGIFPALSASARDAAEALMQKARAAGLFVSFDPNLRPQLWKSREDMRDTLNRLAGYADLVMPGIAEGELLTGSVLPEEIARFYFERGVRQVVVKNGKKGAYAALSSGESFTVPGFTVKKVVDTVGAGDGFAAGVISALAEDLPLREAVRRGCAIGAMQVMSVGDNEGLPTRQQLEDFMNQGGEQA